MSSIGQSLTLWLACCGMLAGAQDFFFLQMSDPQFGMYAENRNFTQETANFEFAIATANRLKPAFVIVCGDLINRAGDSAQTAEYQRIAHKLDAAIPMYNVAGNHDVGNEPTPESLATYRKNFGRDYYTFRQGDFEGIVLNSSLIQHPDKAPEEAARQEQWAKEELSKAAAARVRWVVVFQHIPWFLKAPGEDDQYFNIPRTTRARWLEMLRGSGVRYVFAGHYHRNADADGDGLEMITTGPVGKPLGPDPSGLRVVSVEASGIRHRYYGLGNVPNQVVAGLPPALTAQQTTTLMRVEADSHQLNREVSLDLVSEREGLSAVLRSANNPGGIVMISGCGDQARCGLRLLPASLSLANAFDTIVSLDGAHNWTIQGGVVNLVPKEGMPEIMQVAVGHFEWETGAYILLTVSRLFYSPTVRK